MVGEDHQAVLTRILSASTATGAKADRSQSRLEMTESFAATKVIILLLILLKLAEPEGSWFQYGASTSCYLQGKHELLWRSLPTNPPSHSLADAAERGRG